MSLQMGKVLSKDGRVFVYDSLSNTDPNEDIDSSQFSDRDHSHDCLLHQYVRKGNCESLKMFFNSNEVNVNVRNSRGMTPLHLAVHLESIEIIKYLVSVGADVNAKNDEGVTPLHLAVRTGNIEILTFLLSNGANVHVENNEKLTPLDLAILKNNIEILDKFENVNA